MRKLIAASLVAMAMAGCSAVKSLPTLSAVTINPTMVIVAANSFDAVEATASNYLRYCTPAVQPKGCSATAIAKIIPAIRSGRIARNNLEAFLKANPGQLGLTGDYAALLAATDTLRQIEAQYSIGGAS